MRIWLGLQAAYSLPGLNRGPVATRLFQLLQVVLLNSTTTTAAPTEEPRRRSLQGVRNTYTYRIHTYIERGWIGVSREATRAPIARGYLQEGVESWSPASSRRCGPACCRWSRRTHRSAFSARHRPTSSGRARREAHSKFERADAVLLARVPYRRAGVLR
jgi:hypothetical protein